MARTLRFLMALLIVAIIVGTPLIYIGVYVLAELCEAGGEVRGERAGAEHRDLDHAQTGERSRGVGHPLDASETRIRRPGRARRRAGGAWSRRRCR